MKSRHLNTFLQFKLLFHEPHCICYGRNSIIEWTLNLLIPEKIPLQASSLGRVLLVYIPLHGVGQGGEDAFTILIHESFLNFVQKRERLGSLVSVFGYAHENHAILADVVEQV